MNQDDLQRVANLLVKTYKHEIVECGDWWFGTDHHDFNIHNYGDEESGYYKVNVYMINKSGYINYSNWIDLNAIYIGN